MRREGIRSVSSVSGVYLDYNATTPVLPRVLNAMEPWLARSFGNPSSREHRWGWDAAEAVENARCALAELVGGRPDGVIFTSGATEALNAVVRGYVGFGDWTRKKIIACATEHAAVLGSCRYLCARTGIALEILPVDSAGVLVTGALEAALANTDGALVAVMSANNEVGTLQPVNAIADVVHRAGGIFLCDTTQSFGRVRVDVAASAVDFATLSGHKIYGPKGVGALLVRPGLEHLAEPLILGGGQERGLRAGTLNVPAIVGLGEASAIAAESLAMESGRMARLRDRLEDAVLGQVRDAWVTGAGGDRLCNTSNIGFKGVDARALIRDMHDVAVSTRSACSGDQRGPSHVLTAMGLSDADAYSCVRFSLGRFTTEADIDYAVDKTNVSTRKLRRVVGLPV